MDELVINTPEYPKMKIIIDGKEIEIKVYLSVFSIKSIQKADLNKCDCRTLVEKAFYNLLQDSGLRVSVNTFSDEILFEFIEKTLRENEKLNAIYQKMLEEVSPFERYIYSVRELEVADPYVLINDSLKSITETIRMTKIESLEPALQVAKSIRNQVEESIEPISTMLSAIGKRLSEITESIRQSLKGITIPNISEERKQELISAYTQWGKWGWTGHRELPINALFDIPKSKAEADKYMSQLVSQDILGETIEYIKSNKRIRKTDINEAVFSFDNRQYKACALLLFSIIDSLLIKSMKENDGDNRRGRPVGKKATRQLEKRVHLDEMKENNADDYTWTTLINLLDLVAVLEALNVFFDDGKDFREQPVISNKNFLSHGMQYKPVRKRECIQLFLLLQNFLRLIDIGAFDG